MITWLNPNDCDPPHGLDLRRGSKDFKKVAELYMAFVSDGFDKSKSALVGYPLGGRVQLLSGTHRHTAAYQAGILLPVTLFLRSYVEAYWGTSKWQKLMVDISVTDLENTLFVNPDVFPGLDERVTVFGDHAEPRRPSE